MKKLLLPVLAFAAIGAVISWAQVLPQPGPPVPIACAYNTTPPTLTDGQAGWVQCTSGGKLDVNATVNASVGGFHEELVLSPITATTSGVSSSAFTAGKTVVVTNAGTTNIAYCQLGTTSSTSSQPIAPNGGWFAFTSTSE